MVTLTEHENEHKAGSDRPALEVDITPEMLSAGIEAACLFDPSQDGFEVMLPYIYRAMFLASRALGSRRQK